MENLHVQIVHRSKHVFDAAVWYVDAVNGTYIEVVHQVITKCIGNTSHKQLESQYHSYLSSVSVFKP